MLSGTSVFDAYFKSICLVSIFTDFVTSNLLIVIILSDLNCSFQNVFIYLFIIYVFIYYIFNYLFLFIYFCFRLL